MKKISLFASSVFIFINAFSQDHKPVRGTVTSQVGITFAVLYDNVNSLGLNGRYFLDDNKALRFSYNIMSSKEVRNFAENADGSGASGSYTEKINNHILFLGFEKHFKGTKRLSPYIGAEIGFGFGKIKGLGENADENDFISDYELEMDQKFTGLGINAFLGFDYWVTEGLYIGIEFSPLSKNFNFLSEMTRTDTQSGISTKIVEPKSSYSELSSVYALPFFRLGWRFN